MTEQEELAKLLEKPSEPKDPEVLKLALLLANKAMDEKKFRLDDDGFLLTRNVNF